MFYMLKIVSNKEIKWTKVKQDPQKPMQIHRLGKHYNTASEAIIDL